jgi:zinc D-Ala-D-Ala dipeptidase
MSSGAHDHAAAERPIPALREPSGWRGVVIRECGEPLVALSGYAPARIAVDARYHAAGYPGALAECYARAAVAQRLAAAAAALPVGWRLVVFDAWRPLAVQQRLFDEYLAALRREQPMTSEAALRDRAARYVAPPSVNPACPSPHATGGAIDLSLLDAAGAAVEMGTAFDAFDARAHTRYFERRLEAGERLSAREQADLRHRRLLFHAMRTEGFTNYPEEWWHFDFGNQFHARIEGTHAIYGRALPSR